MKITLKKKILGSEIIIECDTNNEGKKMYEALKIVMGVK